MQTPHNRPILVVDGSVIRYRSLKIDHLKWSDILPMNVAAMKTGILPEYILSVQVVSHDGSHKYFHGAYRWIVRRSGRKMLILYPTLHYSH